MCDTDVVPAATLLVPYFELDLDNPNSRTTLVAVTNFDPEPTLVNVVLWTNWAIPTLSFQIYLTGYDIQTFNLRDVLVHGRLPVTGSAVSPRGDRSAPHQNFPGCNGTTVPGDSPVYADPALDSERLAELQAYHRGTCFAGRRAGSFEGLAIGYITIDVITSCSPLTPADPGYFGPDGVAGDRNVLLGDFLMVDSDESFAQGETAVHVEAFPETFAPGDYTFYRRYVGETAADGREPLGTQYMVRHAVGGSFDGGTAVIFWRDTGSPEAEVLDCGESPGWATGGFVGKPSYWVEFDEDGGAHAIQEGCATLPPCPATFRLATQKVGLNPSNPFGMHYFTTRPADGFPPDPSTWEVLQGWVSVILSAEDRYSLGIRASRLDSACDPGDIILPPEP